MHLKRLKSFLSLFLIATLVLPIGALFVTPVEANTGSTERIQWDSISYVYLERDSNGNVTLGEGASFGEGKKVIYYTLQSNKRLDGKKIKSIKSVKIESITDASQVSESRRQFFEIYQRARGGLSNANVVKKEVRNDNTIHLETNIAANPKMAGSQIDFPSLINITTLQDFERFQSLGADIPDTIGERRAQLEKQGKSLYVMPMFLLFTAEVEVENDNLPDISVRLSNLPGETQGGQKHQGRVTVKHEGNVDFAVTVKLGLTHNGYTISGVDGQMITLQPGESKSFDFTFTGITNTESTLEAKVWPVDPVSDDANWANNSYKVLIPPDYIDVDVPLSGKLILQAVSQSKKTTRPPGEAKWTDWVTATLKPDAPTPPRGTLDWWRITKAELTYPKKHPEFTFGTPYQPKGTVTVPMNIKSGGHEAEVVFQQDWSMDGTPIYSILEKRMMTTEKPRAYPIEVTYTIEYQYSWRECDTSYDEEGNPHTSCWTETRTRTVSSKETASLLVTGTGVDSKAN